MTWEIHFIEDLNIVETVFVGPSTGPELLEAAKTRIKVGKRHNTNLFIINAKAMIVPRSVTVEIYEIPSRIYPENRADRQSCIAVVIPTDPDSLWVNSFFEDVCFNRGWLTKSFRDRANAIEWLLEQSNANND